MKGPALVVVLVLVLDSIDSRRRARKGPELTLRPEPSTFHLLPYTVWLPATSDFIGFGILDCNSMAHRAKR